MDLLEATDKGVQPFELLPQTFIDPGLDIPMKNNVRLGELHHVKTQFEMSSKVNQSEREEDAANMRDEFLAKAENFIAEEQNQQQTQQS